MVSVVTLIQANMSNFEHRQSFAPSSCDQALRHLLQNNMVVQQCTVIILSKDALREDYCAP